MLPLKDLARRNEEYAARQLGLSRQTLLECQSRLDQLSSFRMEYIQQMQQAGNAGINGQQLQTFQQFISQLDFAINQQKQRIAVAEMNCHNQTRQWQEKHQKTEALNKAIDRMQFQERRNQLRKEQREQDEFRSKSRLPDFS